MNFDDDLDDSFGQFLSDNNNILFRKLTNNDNKNELNSSVKKSPRKTPKKSATIVGDIILISSEDEEIQQHRKVTPEKKNREELIDINSNSSSDVEPVYQSTPANSRNIDNLLQNLTDVTFSDFSYLKDSPFLSTIGKPVVETSTIQSVIIHKEIIESSTTTKTALSTDSLANQQTPSKASNRQHALPKGRLIPGSVKKNHRLPGKKAVPKSTKTSSSTEFVAPKPTALQQKDAVRHIVVHMSNKVYDLLKDELAQADPEKRFNCVPFEQNTDSILYCPYIYWKPSLKLKELLEKSSQITNYNPPTFNQLMFLVTPEMLHRNVHAYVKKEISGETFIDDSFIDLMDVMKKCSTDVNKCSQMTLLIHGLDDYLKAQRNKANRQFRRQMNEIMSANDEQQQQRKKTNKNKNKDTDGENENLVELTLENIDMYLIDLGMKFLLQFGGIGSANLTPVVVESISEIVDVIYRYSRSLSEQIFRNDRRGDAASEVYMITNKIAALEIDESKGRSDVEKVWLKQLQQMPSMKASVSKAIVEHFPTPNLLWNRLQNSTNPVGLLSRIGQGNAKVGLDLAQKIHLFMTGNMPLDVLKTATSART